MRGSLAYTSPRSLAAGALALGCAVAIGFVMLDVAYRVSADAAPVVLFAIALVPAAVVAVLYRPLYAVGVVFLAMPLGSLSVPIPLPLSALQDATPPLLELVVIGVTALVAVRRIADGESPLTLPSQLRWGLLLLGWTCISLIWAGDTTLAVKQVFVLAGGLLLASLVYTVVETMDDARWVLGAYVVVALGVGVAAVSGGASFQSQSGGEVVSGRLSGAFSHPNQLGLFSAICIALAVGLGFGARTRERRAAASIAAVLGVVPLLLSLSRSSWIGCGLALLYFLVILREARRALVFAAIPIALAASVVGSFAPTGTEVQVVGERASVLLELSPYDQRSEIYEEALRQLRENPLVGEGPGNFPAASAREEFADATVRADHAHNLWLTWAAEGGVPAAVLVIALMVAVAVAAHRARRAAAVRSRRDHAVIAGIVAALLAVVGQGFFDYLLRNAVLFMIVWALVGALLACARIYGRGDGSGAGARHRLNA